jgi:amino acid adenylation domain-containing protein
MDQLINRDSPHYNVGGYIRLSGELDIIALKAAVQSVPEKFDVFRMRFDIDGPDQVYTVDDQYADHFFQEIDFSNSENPETVAQAWMQGRFNTPFLLEKDCLPFEHCLIKVSNEEYFFFNRYHHLVTDGYGFAVWANYIADKYRSLTEGWALVRDYPLYGPEADRGDAYYRSADYQKEGEYWRNKFPVKPERYLLPRQGTAGAGSNRTGKYVYTLAAAERGLLDALQAGTGASLQVLTIAALVIYFSKATGRREFVFGIPLHKRRSRQQRNIVGMFSGVLPFKGAFIAQKTVKEMIVSISADLKADYRRQNLLLGELSRHFKNDNAAGFLDIVINYQPLDFELDFGNALRATTYELSSEFSKYPIQLWWRDYGKQQPLQVFLDFQEQYLTAGEAEGLVRRLIFLISRFGGLLHEPIATVEMVDEQEKHELLRVLGVSVVGYPGGMTVTDLFEAQVDRMEDGPAVVCGDRVMSYRELDRSANAIAHMLRERGVRTGSRVGLCMERSVEMIAGLLGIFKAGAAYVPLEAGHPADRLRYMLEDTGAAVVLTDEGSHSFLPEWKGEDGRPGLAVICDASWEQSRPHWGQRGVRESDSAGLAYVIFTSGTTGRSKGVMVSHENLVDYVYGLEARSGIGECRSFALVSTLSADLGNTVIYPSLLSGGVLHVMSRELIADGRELADYLRRREVDCMKIVPSHWRALSQGGRLVLPGRLLIFGGEVLPVAVVESIRRTGGNCRIINHYGPTETTIGKLLYEVGGIVPAGGSIPIGRPFGNSQVYVLDGQMGVCPPGVGGELYIGGKGVSQGYWGRPELTAERFVANPYGEGTLYRTGDRVRWLVEGQIEYLGRVDEQVKIRGYRVELAEIEAVLRESGLVEQAVVVAREVEQGQKWLVGYVTGEVNLEELQEYLRRRLPEYMLPGQWVELEALPLTANGKVDRQALPEPGERLAGRGGYVEPRSETEWAMAAIWAGLLNIERIGINDNFFELGGHSIIAIQVVSRAREAGFSLRPQDIFTYQTIARLAGAVGFNAKSEAPAERDPWTGIAQEELDLFLSVEQDGRQRRSLLEAVYPLSPLQEGMLFHSLYDNRAGSYVEQFSCAMAGLIPDRFMRSWELLAERHSILRSSFYADALPVPVQGVWRTVSIPVYRRDLRPLDAAGQQQAIGEYLDQDRRQGFLLHQAPLMRIALLQLGEERYRLIWTSHHIAGWLVVAGFAGGAAAGV